MGVKAFAKENALKEFEEWLEAGGPKSAKITFWSATSCEYEQMADFSIHHYE
ncbi:acylphosphatase [Shigella sp. FC1967]|uniref:hypothetical protein n=1 Tax=Shigella sp. FC1967 TaxID=1898041 RepID=UPI002570A04C|nr:hypothetical protein [Shigella sp. FC1967]